MQTAQLAASGQRDINALGLELARQRLTRKTVATQVKRGRDGFAHLIEFGAARTALVLAHLPERFRQLGNAALLAQELHSHLLQGGSISGRSNQAFGLLHQRIQFGHCVLAIAGNEISVATIKKGKNR